MKKIISLVVICALCVGSICPVFASNTYFNIETVAVELVNIALKQPSEFGLPDLCDETLYLCNKINPYTLSDDELDLCNDIEYYMIMTEESFIACVTLCYENGALLSACLDTSVAKTLNNFCCPEDAFQLVALDGTLFVITEDYSTNVTRDTPSTRRTSETAAIIESISQADSNPRPLTIKNRLSGIVTNPIGARASVTLSVPYVSQEGYPICWAAAAASFGRYYTGSTYSAFSASQLASMVGVGLQGGTMNDARTILSSIFHINTTYSTAQLSSSATIALLQQGKPVLAGFSGSYNDTGNPVGHMVVISGFDSTTTRTTFYVRDPNYTAYKIVTAYSRDVAMDYYQGITMFWDETAY